MKNLSTLVISIERIKEAITVNIRTKAEKTALTLEEYIQSLRSAGMADKEIKKLLLTDLDEGGRIFGEFYRGLGMDITGKLGEVSNAASYEMFGFKPEDKLTWVSVSIEQGDKACPDCEPRHGESDTYGNWILRGLPKSGFSVCRTYCKCKLIRSTDIVGEEGLKNPIKI